MYKWIVLKRRIESTIMFPFVALGRMIASFQKKEDFEIYFFFPFHHIGGAEKVHYQIAQTFTGKNAVIYFTRKSKKESFLQEFQKTGFVIRDLSRFTDNKWIYPFSFIFRGLISYKINHQKNAPLVFNGQSNFGYKISPWVSKRVPQVDLIHALCSFSKIRIPFLQFYKRSVTVSQEIIDKHERLYEKYKMPAELIANIEYINYGIDLPERKEKSFATDVFRVLYVGRGSPEKRIHLIAKIAKEVAVNDANIRFNFLGDAKPFVPEELWPYCNFLGSVTDEDKVDEIYRENDVLMVTSETESGPLVVPEAMARGLCILATPVGIINEHVVNGRNGFVFSSVEDTQAIIKEATTYIKELNENRALFSEIANNNIEYAYANFGLNHFKQSYTTFLNRMKASNR